ncbi:hypothetical protein [Streptomyces sp. NPDC048577]|uniref:hypothetical protein n=1 Tax=Streptomyces sp. NPDC048577 TaxID=3157209 RepID=UPI00343519EF
MAGLPAAVTQPRHHPVPKALTSLDHRVEVALGFSVDRLWRDQDRGLLDEQTDRLATAHRALSDAERSVTFYRVLLHRLASGEYAIEEALFPRIERTVDQLRQAVSVRDTKEKDLTAVLDIAEAHTTARTAGPAELTARETALLLAISQGAHLRENILTQRLSVTTASGTRIGQRDFDQLEQAGLLQRDTARPLHAGQPVTLTDAGRAALSARPAARVTSRPAPRPGTWPDPAGRSRH